MLSFMRERELEDSSAKELPASSRVPTDSAEQLQEQVDTKTQQQKAYGGAEEYLAVAARQKQARKSTMLLAVLFGMGLLCLWFMIKKSTPQTATGAIVSTEEVQIEMAIARFGGVRSEMFNRMDEIVKKFYEFSDVQQVKVNELVKNPFNSMLDARYSMLDSRYSILDGRESRIENQGDEMQLLSIMQSDAGNCCMIDDKILYEGDSIKGFKVSQISDSFVKLRQVINHELPRIDTNTKTNNESVQMANRGRLGTPSEGAEIILKLFE